MWPQIRPAIVVFVILSAITGLAYPLLVTGIAAVAFPWRANGSVVTNDTGKAVGSRLIGQYFSEPGYFWPRPSATSPVPYTSYSGTPASCATGSNSGPTNPALFAAVKRRVARLRAANPTEKGPVPVDLVTSSASGLDPDISAAAAYYQVARVAKARGLPATEVRQLVEHFCRGRLGGVLGSPHVNVLMLNLALDRLSSHKTPRG
ncbi:MAG: potassium-transporting ATPase subunit KdpC [Phycisphaerales bacterium]|nr:potassium-transporting ATPase subunit KdpC [Phycisphaerales bacterium]